MRNIKRDRFEKKEREQLIETFGKYKYNLICE